MSPYQKPSEKYEISAVLNLEIMSSTPNPNNNFRLS